MMRFALVLLALGFGTLAMADDHVYRRSMGNNPNPYALHNPHTNPMVAPGAHVPNRHHNPHYQPNPHHKPHNPHYKPHHNPHYRHHYHYRPYPYYYPYNPYNNYYFYYNSGALYGPRAIFGVW